MSLRSWACLTGPNNLNVYLFKLIFLPIFFVPSGCGVWEMDKGMQPVGIVSNNILCRQYILYSKDICSFRYQMVHQWLVYFKVWKKSHLYLIFLKCHYASGSGAVSIANGTPVEVPCVLLNRILLRWWLSCNSDWSSIHAIGVRLNLTRLFRETINVVAYKFEEI